MQPCSGRIAVATVSSDAIWRLRQMSVNHAFRVWERGGKLARTGQRRARTRPLNVRLTQIPKRKRIFLGEALTLPAERGSVTRSASAVLWLSVFPEAFGMAIRCGSQTRAPRNLRRSCVNSASDFR